MKSSSKKSISILLACALIALVLYIVVGWLVDMRTNSLRVDLENRIVNQSSKLITIADATRQNSADEAVATIIKDCATDKRKEFDTLLDKLSTTISKSELSQLTGLFYQCGNFYAQQRSMMALTLNREVSVLDDMVNLSVQLSAASTTQELAVKKWQHISVAETKIASFFTQLVDLQGSIIAALSAGNASDSTEVTTALAEVAQVRGQMVVLSKQVEDYRTALVSI